MTLMTERLKRKFNNDMMKEAFGIFVVLCLIIGVVVYTPRASADEGTIPFIVHKQSQPLNIPAPTLIKQQTLEIDVPQAFDDENAPAFANIEQILRTTTNSVIVLRVTGMGGDALLLNGFLRAMEDAKSHGNLLLMDVVGPAASAHALITCYADQVVVRPGASILFHQGYGMISLFYGLVTYRSLGDDPMFMTLSDHMLAVCVSKGRLTEQDVNTIKSGDDVVIRSTDDGFIKQYNADGASVMSYTIPMLVIQLSSILAVLTLLYSVVYIIRRAGVQK